MFFTQIYSKIATGNVTKNSKKNLFVFFTQIYYKIATGNVTKYLKKDIDVFHSVILQNSHWKCHIKILFEGGAPWTDYYTTVKDWNVCKDGGKTAQIWSTIVLTKW